MAGTLSGLIQILRYNQRILVYPHAFDPSVVGNTRQHTHKRARCDNIEIVAKDGIRIRCYTLRHKQSRSRGTIILFHGNAMDCVDAGVYADGFFARGLDVLSAEYRGYNGSTGKPSEAGLRLDAQAALDYVLADPELSSKPILLFGQSLGGGVVIDLASRNGNHAKLAGLVLENTFTSIPDIIRPWPYIGPLNWMCTQRWNSISRIGRIPKRVRVMMLVGERDRVVPPSMMSGLWAARWGAPFGEMPSTTELPEVQHHTDKRTSGSWRWSSCTKVEIEEEFEEHEENKDRYKTFPGGSHNNTFLQPGYWDAVTEFLDSVLDSTSQIEDTHS